MALRCAPTVPMWMLPSAVVAIRVLFWNGWVRVDVCMHLTRTEMRRYEWRVERGE